jgi:hypothetical protein
LAAQISEEDDAPIPEGLIAGGIPLAALEPTSALGRVMLKWLSRHA